MFVAIVDPDLVIKDGSGRLITPITWGEKLVVYEIDDKTVMELIEGKEKDDG